MGTETTAVPAAILAPRSATRRWIGTRPRALEVTSSCWKVPGRRTVDGTDVAIVMGYSLTSSMRTRSPTWIARR